MKTLVIIINGIHLPYAVIDHAIELAAKESYQVNALFLRSQKEPKKGYLFPSDLETTHSKNYDAQATLEDEKIMDDNMRLVKEMVESEKIPYQASLRTNASMNDIEKDTATADLIIVDKDFDNPSLLSDSKISLKELANKLSGRLKVLPGTS